MRYGYVLPTATPDAIRAIKAYVGARRTETTPFDIVAEGAALAADGDCELQPVA